MFTMAPSRLRLVDRPSGALNDEADFGQAVTRPWY